MCKHVRHGMTLEGVSAPATDAGDAGDATDAMELEAVNTGAAGRSSHQLVDINEGRPTLCATGPKV